MRLNKRGHLKRIFAFIMALLLVLQPSYRLGRNVFASEQTIGEDSVSDYTIYFCASDALNSAIQEYGVYVYAYNENEEAGIENPEPLIKAENYYTYTLNQAYAYVKFLLGTDLETSIQSEPYKIDWKTYPSPCFTVELVYNDDVGTLEVQAVDNAVSQITSDSDEKDTETSSEEDSEESSENDSEGNESVNPEVKVESTTESVENTKNSEEEIIATGTEEDEDDLCFMAGYEVATAGYELDSNYLYLNPAGMTRDGVDWSTAEMVYLYVDTWGSTDEKNGFKEGAQDTTTGYWYWDISSWGNTDHRFAFSLANSWSTIKEKNYYRTDTSDSLNLTLTNVKGKGKVFIQNDTCTIDGKTAYAIKEFTSLKNETLYFMDYTGQYSSVSACFSDSSAFPESSDDTTTLTMGYVDKTPKFFTATIPGDQTYVKFTEDETGIQLGDIYNIYGGTETATGVTSVFFASSTNDTLHYGVTEKADGTLINTWGASPGTESDSLQGKTLYFDKLHFPVENGGKLQIGSEETVELSVDTGDKNTLSYTFPTDTSANQQTLLTFIDKDGTKYHFKWNDLSYNKVTLNDSVANVSEEYVKGNTVYFDATLSKLEYESTAGDYGIPNKSGTIRYYATGKGKQDIYGDMEHAAAYTANGHTWNDVYKVDLPDGYTNIVFSSFDMEHSTNYGGHGESTTTLTIPENIINPCFYADTSDSVIYDGKTRDGYWASVYSIRDAESGKTNKDVVDIKKATFTRKSSTLYINSTFYDYYTDYELNGNNRDDYGGSNGGSQRNWVTFRQFNQALSDYYQSNSANIPIYTGHFQPTYSNWGNQFSVVADTLNLYGYSDYNKFFSTNNSNFDNNGTKVDTNTVAKGLVSSSLSNNNLMMATANGVVEEPHFNEAFLTGDNSKNTVLGEVYHDVAFPFEQKDINKDGVMYWCFDSAETTLAMRQDGNSYYLADVGNQNWSKNVNSSSAEKSNANYDEPVSTEYGFFPFNENTKATSAKNYNYGYGVKLEFQFRLTEDGTVLDKDGKPVDITFNFSGDDDVWVFIDGNLVLDVGGAHGVAEGSINFATKKATVNAVKASAGDSSPATETTFALDGSNTSEHTLTMYYMERGMWESNMKITFNFPDENELEVEKKVDESDVNELFKGLFEGKSLFTYNIKNQATHYSTYEVDTSTTTLPVTFNYTFASEKIYATSSNNTFKYVDSKDGQTNVALWNAQYTDSSGSYRLKRYGVIKPSSGESVDITNMSYLEFKFYYDYSDKPSLSNMYIQLVDTAGKIKGNTSSYLSGKTYGIVPMANKEWITVRIDLSKLSADSDFNNQVAEIRFGYNYPRDIYLDDFIFYPSAVSAKDVGFITKQYYIPDYGSAKSGKLEIPEGALYTSSEGGTYSIGSDGTFVLADGETITFSDQFRRGSYIYLEEIENSLFTTSWTMYENGQAVASSQYSADSVTTVKYGSSTYKTLTNVSGYTVEDDRTEVVTKTTVEGQNTLNAYTTEAQPSVDTFVFRSYADPDNATVTTKLKVVYTNKVKVGSLTINKTSLYGENELAKLTGDYKIKVTFSNVGGIGLEDNSIEVIVTLKAGESYTFTGIPLGTHYTVEELESEISDGSYLGAVEINNDSNMIVDPSTKIVKGEITEKTEEASETDTVTFKNTLEPKISVTLTKNWIDEQTGDILETGTPGSIYVQLQRRTKGSEEVYKVVEGYEKVQVEPNYQTNAETGAAEVVWKYTVNGLDWWKNYEKDFGNGNSADGNGLYYYEYRFVEVDETTGAVIENGTVITLQSDSNNKDYEVKYDESTQDDSKNYSNTITNTLLGPVKLKIIKTTAQNTRLPGVTFKLEMLDETTKSYVAVPDGEQTTSEHTDNTDNGTQTGGEILFSGLENGQYKLTEVATADGYTLLKEPLIIVINRRTGTYTYRMESENAAKEMDFNKKETTVTLTITNATNIVLPPTGVQLPIPVLAVGVILCVVTTVLYKKDKKKCRKEGEAPDA